MSFAPPAIAPPRVGTPTPSPSESAKLFASLRSGMAAKPLAKPKPSVIVQDILDKYKKQATEFGINSKYARTYAIAAWASDTYGSLPQDEMYYFLNSASGKDTLALSSKLFYDQPNATVNGYITWGFHVLNFKYDFVAKGSDDFHNLLKNLAALPPGQRKELKKWATPNLVNLLRQELRYIDDNNPTYAKLLEQFAKYY